MDAHLNNDISDLRYMTKDLLEGDNEVSQLQGFSSSEKSDIDNALKWIINKSGLSEEDQKRLMMNSWRLHYKSKPPSIKEFLTTEWIGPTAEDLYPNVERILTEYWQPNSQYRHLILGAAIGTGKSFTSTLSSLYVTTHLHLLKNPKQFFGLSQATSIVHALISFSMEKAGQLLLQPFMQILLSTEKFKRVKMEERLDKAQKENPDKICWTTAGKMGSLQFHGDIHYMLASSPQKLLGLNMISATMSELSFFLDQGMSAEYIWRIYNDAKGRVKNRFGERYFAGTIMDSSPNDMEESPIDKYIFTGTAEKDHRNYVVTGDHWTPLYFKDTYVEWRSSAAKKLGKPESECTVEEFKEFGDYFPVFKGSAGDEPRILTPEEETKFLPDDIYHVPIDLHQNFEDDILKSVKDYCGWPAGSSGKLFKSWEPIEAMFYPTLRNVYTYIMAPNTKPAERLIWDQLKTKFWVRHAENKYEFYRAPTAIRYMHLDQSESGDMTGISMVHVETQPDGTWIYVTDFTIGIIAGKDKISFEAIRQFIMDMRKYGGIRFGKITFDQFQSKPAIQYLKEKEFPVGYLSVERDLGPYMTYITIINTGLIKCGRNIFLKNNIKSLQEIKTNSGKKKIDHKKGKAVFDDGGNWETSLMGVNANDVADSHCGAVYNAINEFKGIPTNVWNPKLEEIKEEKRSREEKLEENILSKYGLTF